MSNDQQTGSEEQTEAPNKHVPFPPKLFCVWVDEDKGDDRYLSMETDPTVHAIDGRAIEVVQYELVKRLKVTGTFTTDVVEV